jgi:hypothetical protein
MGLGRLPARQERPPLGTPSREPEGLAQKHHTARRPRDQARAPPRKEDAADQVCRAGCPLVDVELAEATPSRSDRKISRKNSRDHNVSGDLSRTKRSISWRAASRSIDGSWPAGVAAQHLLHGFVSSGRPQTFPDGTGGADRGLVTAAQSTATEGDLSFQTSFRPAVNTANREYRVQRRGIGFRDAISGPVTKCHAWNPR